MTDFEQRLVFVTLTVLLLTGVVAATAYAAGYAARAKEITWLKSELTMANDRLYLAWKDEAAKIPARQDVQPPAGASVVVPIPPELERFVERYEADEGKNRARQEIFTLRAKGMSDDAIWMELQRRYGDF